MPFPSTHLVAVVNLSREPHGFVQIWFWCKCAWDGISVELHQLRADLSLSQDTGKAKTIVTPSDSSHQAFAVSSTISEVKTEAGVGQAKITFSCLCS